MGIEERQGGTRGSHIDSSLYSPRREMGGGCRICGARSTFGGTFPLRMEGTQACL